METPATTPTPQPESKPSPFEALAKSSPGMRFVYALAVILIAGVAIAQLFMVRPPVPKVGATQEDSPSRPSSPDILPLLDRTREEAERPPRPFQAPLPPAPPVHYADDLATIPEDETYAPGASPPGVYDPFRTTVAPQTPRAATALAPATPKAPAVDIVVYSRGRETSPTARSSVNRDPLEDLTRLATDLTLGAAAAHTASPPAESSELLARPQPDRRHQFLDQPIKSPLQPFRIIRTAKPASLILHEGTPIAAFLAQGLSSESPGMATAIVRRDVLDSTGSTVVIPAGSRLIGIINPDVVYGDKRLLAIWTRLLLPDGSSFGLPNVPAADPGGAAGISSDVNNHWFRLIGTALALTAVSAGAQLSQPETSLNTGSLTSRQVAAAALGQNLGDVASNTLRRELQVRPTLTLEPGVPLALQLTRDLEFVQPWAE